jgi:peroxiredoxin
MDWMLAFASVSPEMEKFLLVKFVNRYLNQKYMWEDKVFVHLYEKYFSQKNYPWLTEKGRKTIFDRAYSLMANLFGNPASDIELPDTTEKVQRLYSITNPYVIVCFWDPSCSHCKETLPKIDSVFRSKWKKSGVSIYAIAKESDAGKPEWKNFIHDHNLDGWVHVYYSKSDENARVSAGIPGYMQLYDVLSVPTLYLLDKDKRIIAKKIPYEQIDEVLQFKLKGQ